VIDVLRQDTAYALRGLVRSPGLTLTVIGVLGLGVGANAAIFTVLDRIFFRAPPGVVDPGSLRRLYAHNYSRRLPYYGPDGDVSSAVSNRDLHDLDSAVRSTARIVGEAVERRAKLQPGDRPLLVSNITPGYFELLGIRPALGRFFAPNETGQADRSPVVVIGDAFWRRELGADPNAVGQSIRVDDMTYSIVGIAPRDFEGLDIEVIDLWVPLPNRPTAWVGALARLEPGADPRVLAQRLTAQYRRTHVGDPYVEEQSEIVTGPILAARGPPGVKYRLALMPDRSLALLPRLAALGLVVVLIALANVGSLLLMRAVRRRREIAVRLALGISRRRLLTQLLTESGILAAVAAGVALLLARVTSNLLRAELSDMRWPGSPIDQRVAFFALLVAVGAGVIAGLAPALFALKSDVVSGLKASASDPVRGGAAMRAGLLVTQSALCMALLACGGAFLRSLEHAVNFDRGFDPKRLVLLWVPSYVPNADAEFARVAERIRALPQVEAAGQSPTGLSGGADITAMVGTSAVDTVGEGTRGPSIEFVEPEFLEAAGFRAVAGRFFERRENAEPVAVVNQALAERLWPRGHPVGSCFYIRAPRVVCRTVVGVVRDIRESVTALPVFRAYLPRAQAWIRGDRSFLPNYLTIRMRSVASPQDLTELRHVIAPLLAGGGADVNLFLVRDLFARELRPWRLAAVLILLLGGLGLLAATAGIYGLVAYDVSQRSRELGVRISLGASRSNILRLVLTAGLRIVVFGLGIGAVIALAAGRVVASLLFETSPYDPLILLVTASALGTAATLASLVPAWRATKVDPVTVLREV
jgi:predicted permease